MSPATSSTGKNQTGPLFLIHPLLGQSLLKLSHFLHISDVELALVYTQKIE